MCAKSFNIEFLCENRLYFFLFESLKIPVDAQIIYQNKVLTPHSPGEYSNPSSVAPERGAGRGELCHFWKLSLPDVHLF